MQDVRILEYDTSPGVKHLVATVCVRVPFRSPRAWIGLSPDKRLCRDNVGFGKKQS